ncbi:MAG TPA: hypothetical protein VH183_09130 [Burkholderiaceae bacterium]|nr:hypothetical protein [Burkholderiaceae bacterium]
MLPEPSRSADARLDAEPQPQTGLLHTHEEFDFVVNAPVDVAAPLFGAEAERAWAPDWDPAFVWPQTPSDRPGMVFKVSHGDRTAVWVNTAFDRVANRIQYVYVIPDIVVTVVTLGLTPRQTSTHVAVTYERTALTQDANERVRQMAARDAASGPEWGRQINDCLKTRPPVETTPSP